MASVLGFPTAFLDVAGRAPEADGVAPGKRGDYSTELSIAATRFELAVGVGAMIGGLVGLGVGATVGGIIGAAPASAIGAVAGAAALGIPIGIYSWVQMKDAVSNML